MIRTRRGSALHTVGWCALSVLGLIAVATPNPASGQFLPAPLGTSATAETYQPQLRQSRRDSTRVDPKALVAGGILGGLGGMLAGSVVALPLASMSSNGHGDDYAGLLALAAGMTIGEVLGVSFGVHRAGGRRGSFLIDAAASAAVATAALLLIDRAGDLCNGCDALFAAAVPVFQIGAVIAVDRAWARR